MRTFGPGSRRAAEDVRRRGSAVLHWGNYRAAARSLTTYVRPIDGLRRYAVGSGIYPHDLRVRTPLGIVTLQLPHPHDMRTVNEVFCRADYGRGRPRTVIDIGANIGVSAVYFLTRHPETVVHCYEPHPDNLVTLRANLAPFADRVVLHTEAVAPESGTAAFVADPVGRYSGLAAFTPRSVGREITVTTRSIEDVVRSTADELGPIDLLKIDTEGSERALLAALGTARAHVRETVWEDDGVVRRERAGE